MKTSLMSLAATVCASLSILHVAQSSAASEIVAFGLTNRSINSATISPGEHYQELRVTGLATLGYKGLRVHLGQADSGLFFSPYTYASLENRNFMSGHAYGRSAGLDRRLSSVYCERKEWATYPIHVDFLPLGAVSKTVQIFVDDVFVGEETYTNGPVTVSTSNSDNLGPRVNPLWRAPDGSVGVLLEFTQSTPPIYLPSGRYTYANRLFIRANRPLFNVDYVSRVDIYGGGGLAEFSARDELLGMFGRPHRALGGAIFTARKDRLIVANCADAGTDGVMVELGKNSAFQMEFRPVSMAATGALFHLSATGNRVGHYPYPPAAFLGPLKIENREGEKNLRMDAPGTNACRFRVTVFDGTVQSGEFTATGTEFAGSLGTNNLDIVSSGVIGGTDVQQAALAVQFRTAATLTSGPYSLRGDRVHVSLVEPLENPATFASFQVLACGVPPFTIIKETAADAPPVVLDIERLGTNVVVSFPGFASPYSHLETSDTPARGPSWRWVDGETLPWDGLRVRKIFPVEHENAEFFRMVNYAAQILDPYIPD